MGFPAKTADSKIFKIAFAIFSLLVILFIGGDLTIHNQGGYLILFSLIYVLIPGLLLISAIDKDFFKRYKGLTPVIAFYSGFTLLIFQYYALNALGLLSLIKFTPVLIAILLFIPGRRNLKEIIPKTEKKKLLDDSVPYLLLTAILMTISYVVMTDSVPDQTSILHIDYSYHMGNVNILTRAGSLEDTRIMGMTFKYHYFADLYYAILRLIFPAGIWNCVLRYHILFIPLLVGSSIFSFIRSKTGKTLPSFIVTLLIILCPSLIPAITKFSVYNLTNSNGVGFALSLTIAVASLLIQSSDESSTCYSDLIILFLLTLCLAGTKGPFALTLTGAMLIFTIYCAIDKRKISRYQIAAFITIASAFAIIWFTLLNVAVNDQNIENSGTGLLKYFNYQIQLPDGLFSQAQLSDTKFAILLVPFALLCTFSGAAIPLMILVPVLLADQFLHKVQKRDYTTVFAAICSCIGIGGAYLLAVDYNRIYFLMLAVPFFYFAAFGFFEMARSAKKKVLTILTVIVMVISGLFTCFSVVNSVLTPEKIAGFELLTQEELDAISWIKENTNRAG